MMKNFSERLEEFFRKDVTYDNIQIKISKKKNEKASLSKKYIVEKKEANVKLNPPAF